MSIQESITKASEKLSESYENHKLAQDTLKELKKELKNELKKSDEYTEIEERSKKLKVTRKEIWEELKELGKMQDQIAAWLDQYEAVQDFALTMEEKFSEVKDKELNKLSRELTEKWMIAEVEYRCWKLIFIVAKHV